jgi:glycosyltransferase involved in cell wall biosynthesis
LKDYLKKALERNKTYRVIRDVKRAIENNLRPNNDPNAQVVTLSPAGSPCGNVLLSYILDPFLVPDGKPISNAHTHDWESLQMARTFVDLGYTVDAINYLNQGFVPEKHYAVVIDVRRNLERWVPLLPSTCIKVFHIDAAHLLYSNAAENRRLLELQARRGVTLQPRRWQMPNRGIELADCATSLGNEFTIDTFRYAGKPIYRLPISVTTVYQWPEAKDFDASRRNYLWFGSGGMVHKGLDLVLEAFASMPDYHLTVCGPVHEEEDFVAAYHKELFETQNIHTVGWIDVESREFVEVCNRCLGLVYPSCSEGGGGSAIHCMHAGLIPIVSVETSVDIRDEYGMVLKESSVEQIRNSVEQLSSLPQREVERMARAAREFVRKNHTRERFAEQYRKFVAQILSVSGQEKWLDERVGIPGK